MTGFARTSGEVGGFTWSWEARSVNGRNLDARIRLPNSFDGLEADLRKALNGRFARGHFSITLQTERGATAQSVRLNREVFDQIARIVQDLGPMPGTQPARLDGLLGLRGVLEVAEPEETEDEKSERGVALRASFDEALASLETARHEEGARIGKILKAQIEEISDLGARAAKLAEGRTGKMRERLAAQVKTLLAETSAVPEDRLAQELAFLVVKADVSEEIDRLNAHVESARELLTGGGAIGRRLDFLCQEFNREANTICSKAGDVDLTRIGLDMKVLIDRVREQVQNIE
jgi:uncharacterized protein (TIGR00255 family)